MKTVEDHKEVWKKIKLVFILMQLSDMHGAGRVKFFHLKIVSKAKFHKIRQEYIFLFREISENKS